MISVFAAPPNAPQVFIQPPGPPNPPRLDRLDHRLIEVVREEGAAQIWWVLNFVGDEETGDRAKARAVRLALWDRVKRLIWLRLIFRQGRKAVGIEAPPPRLLLPRPARLNQRAARIMPRTTARSTHSANAVSTGGWQNSNSVKISAQQVGIQIVGQEFHDDDATEDLQQTKCVPTRDEVRSAAQQLATLPRGRKKWSGWLNDRERIWRDRKVLVDGQPAFAYGALRGQVVYFRDVPREMESGRWGVVAANRVRVWRNPAAQLLGRLKAGRKERPSLLKAEAARRNGKMPCREGKRRGRKRRSAINSSKANKNAVDFLG
ncbi:MAG TPA: hypothetical protein VGO67_14965 [Verrucomicrobiae bacterium]|jgi:hypothetical protein